MINYFLDCFFNSIIEVFEIAFMQVKPFFVWKRWQFRMNYEIFKITELLVFFVFTAFIALAF